MEVPKARPEGVYVQLCVVGHGQDDRWDAGTVRHPGLIRRMRRQGSHARCVRTGSLAARPEDRRPLHETRTSAARLDDQRP